MTSLDLASASSDTLKNALRLQLGGLSPTIIDPALTPSRAAVAVVFRGQSSHPPELLYILRAKHEHDPWSGHMAFPGGRFDAQWDKNPQETVRREVREEIGIDLQDHGEYLGQMDDIRASARGRVIPMAISPFVFWLNQHLPLRPDPLEVAQIHWVHVKTLVDPDHRGTFSYSLDGHTFDLPCLQIQGQRLWGLTYQMTFRLFSLLGYQL